MNHAEVVAKVNEVLQQGFEVPPEKLRPEASLIGDLELDSLDAIDMLVHLEEKLAVKVAGERFEKVRTLGDVYNMVAEIAASREANA